MTISHNTGNYDLQKHVFCRVNAAQQHAMLCF